MTETSALPTDSQPPSQDSSNSGLAIASLLMGIGSFLLSIVTGIPAIICGHLAHSKIKASGGALKGSGMALAGLILGYFSVLMFAVALIVYLSNPIVSLSAPGSMKDLNKAEQVMMVNNLGNLKKALDMHAAGNGGNYPASLNELVGNSLTREGLKKLTTVENMGRLSYVPRAPMNSPKDFLILYQKSNGETTVALKLDSATKALTPEELTTIAEKQTLPQIKE